MEHSVRKDIGSGNLDTLQRQVSGFETGLFKWSFMADSNKSLNEKTEKIVKLCRDSTLVFTRSRSRLNIKAEKGQVQNGGQLALCAELVNA